MPITYANASGQNPADVYDPDVIGDGPVAAINGIGYRDAGGNLLRFAAIGYGSAAPSHGYRLADGRDFSALWAKKGSASYNDAIVIPFGSYSAEGSGTHNAGASLLYTMDANGNWSIALQRSTSGTISGSPLSGNWHKAPAGGVGNNYEVQFVAAVNVYNTYTDTGGGASNPSPSYTASSGWMALSSSRQLAANTDNLTAGSAGTRSGSVNVTGHWDILIRKVGGSAIATSRLNFDIDARVT